MYGGGVLPIDKDKIAHNRSIAAKESRAEEPELLEAWSLYRSVQGCWMPDAPKPDRAKVRRLDSLTSDLKRESVSTWLKEFEAKGPTFAAVIPVSIDDPAFAAQSAVREYQIQKALAICYMAEHELDVPDAANRAGNLLTALLATHPWDWEVHALYARLLADAQLPGIALKEAGYSLCLNPDPSQADIEYFIFIAFTAKAELKSVTEAITEAVTDKQLQCQMIKKTEETFASGKRRFIPAKK